MFLRLSAIFICMAGPAIALCTNAEKVVFSCTIKGGAKALDVCHQYGEARYRYGPTGGAPELELREWIGDLEYYPWPGVGSSIYEEVGFYNGDVRYAVWSSVERNPEVNYPISGGVTVTNGDRTLADLRCDVGSVTTRIDGLFEQKEIEGFCWDFDGRIWRLCAN